MCFNSISNLLLCSDWFILIEPYYGKINFIHQKWFKTVQQHSCFLNSFQLILMSSTNTYKTFIRNLIQFILKWMFVFIFNGDRIGEIHWKWWQLFFKTVSCLWKYLECINEGGFMNGPLCNQPIRNPGYPLSLSLFAFVYTHTSHQVWCIYAGWLGEFELWFDEF